MGDYTKLAESLEQLAKNDDTQSLMKDDASRVRLIEAARAVSLKFEMPFETYFRLVFADMTVGLALTGVELGIWKAIAAKAPNSVSASELAKGLGVLELTMSRILRVAASEYIIDEVGEEVYRANRITTHFTAPRAESVIYMANSQVCRVGSAMPDFFARHKREDPATARPLPVNTAMGSDQAVWEWLSERPRDRDAFNDFMFIQATGLTSFLEAFPLDKYLQTNTSSDRIQFVDVGGGSGHISRAVLSKYPSLYGKIAVEDRPDYGTVSRADFAKDGIQMVPHDFFTPQPLKGAKVFYMRNILHDWPNDKCATILSQLRDGMAEDSVILIDDVVIPPTGAHWYATHSDLMMLTNLAAMERTEGQFEALFADVGLRRESMVRYNEYGPAIQVVVRK